ncbi:hypothetical protein HYW44_04715 [Candidatus Daviesbacteria bacterium]|nr:hypothetical protein [Candidatus Daviesbacteria bacterium]
MGNLKNLLVYISQTKTFSEECSVLAKIQVDNSFSLGWQKRDIIFVTNFSWEYKGVKAIVVGDEHYCAVRPRSIKTAIVPFLIEEGIIEKGKIYWNHDFDAYQLNLMGEAELGLNNFDAGLTDYGWRERWCMGSFFVKTSSKDIFERAKEIIFKNIEDETAMVELTKDAAINKRCKRLNITYDFGMRYVESNYKKAKKPLRVVHFHPKYQVVYPKPSYYWVWTWDVFVNGKNGLNKPLIDKRLIAIFNHHGIK